MIAHVIFNFFSLALLKSASGGKVLEVFKIFKVLFENDFLKCADYLFYMIKFASIS